MCQSCSLDPGSQTAFSKWQSCPGVWQPASTVGGGLTGAALRAGLMAPRVGRKMLLGIACCVNSGKPQTCV